MTSSTAIDGAVGDMLAGGAIAVTAKPTPPPPKAAEPTAAAPAAKPAAAAKKPAAKKKPAQPAAARKPAAAKKPVAKKAASKQRSAPAIAVPDLASDTDPQLEPDASAVSPAPPLLDADDELQSEDYDASILNEGPPDVTDSLPDLEDEQGEPEDGVEPEDDDAQPVHESTGAIAPVAHANASPTLFIPDTADEARDRRPFTPPVPGRASATAEPSPWALLEDNDRASAPEPDAAPDVPEPPKRAKRSIALPLSPRITRGRALAFGALALIGIGLLGGTPSKPPASASTPAPAKPVASATPSATATPAANAATPTTTATATATPPATPARRSSAKKATPSSKRKRRSSARKRARTRVQTRTVYVPVPAPSSAASAAPRTTAPAPAAPRSAPAPSAGRSGFSSEFRP